MSKDKIMNIPFGRPWITDEDRESVLRVLDGPIPHTVQFVMNLKKHLKSM